MIIVNKNNIFWIKKSTTLKVLYELSSFYSLLQIMVFVIL